MWPFKNYWILWQNARNLDYISKFNDDLAKKLADSKLKTKEFLQNKWVKVSETLAVIKNHKELDEFDLHSLPLPFVVKPNAWYGGKWIIVFDTKDGEGNFFTTDGEKYDYEKLLEHTRDILDGFFSLSGSRDKVLFERKLVLDHSIELLGKYGLPDIRIIVFNSVPVIAMLRVPTPNSKGKANLHSGACGLGVDIGSGKITYITQFKKMIKSIPGIGDVRGIAIPHWEDILKLAVKVQQVTWVWYVGCDIVLDDVQWPLLLEMNVRPGLEVQVANKIPLLERLKKVQNIKVNSVDKWVRLARDLFGGDIEEKIKNISWKKVVGNKEYVEVSYGEKSFKVISETKANKPNSYINTAYLVDVLKYPQEKIKNQTVKLKCSFLWETRNVRFVVKSLEVSNMILGRDALYGFLIDPFKYKENELPFDTKNPLLKEKNVVILKGYEEQLLKIDKSLMEVDKKLNILKIITPINLEGERLKFVESKWEYIPTFAYKPIPLFISELEQKVSKIEVPDIPLGQLFKRKKDEILLKLQFIQAFAAQDLGEMNKVLPLLYGTIIPENLAIASEILKTRSEIVRESEFLTFDEIVDYVEKFNHIYGTHISIKQKNAWSRFSLSWDTLWVKVWVNVGKKEIRPVVAHEVEGHYLRKINGKTHKFKIFSEGTAMYLPLEEGIAIYNQSKFLTPKDKKYYSSAERYYFIHFFATHSYKESIEELYKWYGNYESVFLYLVRFKRGIQNVSKKYCFSKDVVYLNGYQEILRYIADGGDVKELFFGKIGLQDLSEIKKTDLLHIKTDDYKIPLFL